MGQPKPGIVQPQDAVQQKPRKGRKGNLFLFTGLIVFMIMFTIVSVMGSYKSLSIDMVSGPVFIVGSILILIGLFF